MFFFANLKSILRDKALWSLVAVSFLSVILVPVLSLLSMRQVQELALTLSFSGASFFLLVCTVFLGAVAIWRDVERRFAVAVLALPVSRTSFVLSKFLSLGSFLLLTLLVLGLLGSFGVLIITYQHPPQRSLVWLNVFVAYGMLGVKYLLLLSLTLLLSTLSTSFFLPIFGSLGLYLAGSASYQVLEFLSHNADLYSPFFLYLVQALYYVLPNFSAFDYQVYAIYGLPISWSEVGASVLYGFVYTTFSLFLAAIVFNRREI